MSDNPKPDSAVVPVERVFTGGWDIPQLVNLPLVSGGLLEQNMAYMGWTRETMEEKVSGICGQLTSFGSNGPGDAVKVICPHMVGGNYGVFKSDVLVVGKMPNVEELDLLRLHSGRRGEMWKEILVKWGVPFDSWMCVNACWHWVDSKKVPDRLFKEWKPMLASVISRVQPKYILCFGSDAWKQTMSLYDSSKAAKIKFGDARGSVHEYFNGSKVVACTGAAEVIAVPSSYNDFVTDLSLFRSLINNTLTTDPSAKYKIHEIYDEYHLSQLVDRLLDENHNLFAMDCEWGEGDFTTGKLRTVQLAWSDTEAAVIVLHRQEMVPAFNPSVGSAIPHLSRLLQRPGVRVAGHNLRGDLRWLMQYGLDLWEQFMAGIDTMLAYHEIDEVGEKQLELVAMRLVGMYRYDLPLRAWLARNGVDKKIIKKRGYAMIPDEILHPYAGMDAVASYAIIVPILKQMAVQPGLADHYFKVVHPTNLALDEMETTGVLIDMDRAKRLIELTEENLARLTIQLQHDFNWPDFNPGSPQQVAELLYDHVPMKPDGTLSNRRRPPDAVCLRATPIKSTDSPRKSVAWERVEQLPANEKAKYNPSTDQESVRILAATHPILTGYGQWKTLDQLRKNFLRAEEEDVETGELSFENGIGSWLGADGRLRTSFRQTLETGRYATSPNLQNWPKRTESDIRRCFYIPEWVVFLESKHGPRYFDGDGFTLDVSKAVHFHQRHDVNFVCRLYNAHAEQLVDPRYLPLRSVLVASPGHVLVEPDWNQAELWTLGACARDDDFLHVLATSDLHTEMMKKMFASMDYLGRKIGDIPTKELKKLAKSDKYIDSLRTCAKTVNFGIPYGRGAAAIIREIMKQGIRDRTVAEAQGWIDLFYETYRFVYEFLEDCKYRASNPGHLVNCFGRYRRFPQTDDRMLIADYEREAVNFPIQSTVGDAMSVALQNFWNYKRVRRTNPFRMLLSIHDAVLLEVPVANVPEVVEQAIPWCMVRDVEMPGLDLRYGIGDIDIQFRWSEKSNPAELEAAGVSRDYCGYPN